MSLLLSLLPLLAQVGPYTPSSPGSGSRLPPPAIEGRNPRSKAEPPPLAAPPPPAGCFALVERQPDEALAAAEQELAARTGAELADALTCKALALSGLERWGEAEAAFLAARDVLPEGSVAARAEREAAAGVAAESGGALERARDHFDKAHDHAVASGDGALAGRIARDRASALLKLGQPEAVAASLAEARAALPGDPATWLISARFARKQDRLVQAQDFIARAAELDPHDPQVGLEAGVIAMLSGREDAARHSWQSVLALAPGSAEAAQAKDYLDQVGANPAPSGR